jgi:hypothetical protein
VLERAAEIAAIPAAVVLVAYDEPSLLGAKMLHDLELPFPLLLDFERRCYADWGMGRTSLFGAMLSPSLNWRYLRLLLRGERFLGVAPDMFQLGGDFIVDAAGGIAFEYRMRGNGDRADVETLVRELKRA